MMNIVIVSAMFPPIKTGTSYYSANIARSLTEIGHKITVVTVENEKGINEYDRHINRIPALHLPVRNYLEHFRVCSLFPSSYTKISKIVRESKADVILLINHYLDIAFPAILASNLNHVPLVCSVGTQLQSCNRRRNRVLNFLDRLICGNLVFPFCAKIVAWDNEILKYLDDVHGQKVVGKSIIINYGVNGNIDGFMAYHHDYSFHNQILGVGAVSEQRNFIPLVRAFSHIALQYPELKLKIIGRIYYDAALRISKDLGLGDRVVFTGEVPHDRVLDEFTHSDMYFVSLTATYVGLGTATIESMLMGIPTIANVPADILGRPVFKDMEHLVLLNDLDPQSIATKIRLLIESRELRQRIGIGGRNFIAHHMNWEKIARDFEQLMEAVCAK